MSAMTPLGAGAKFTIGGNEDDGYYVRLWDGEHPTGTLPFASTSASTRNDLARFVWLVKSAAAFHKIGFDPGPLKDLA